MAILWGKMSGVEGIDRKSAEVTPELGGSGGIGGGAGKDVDDVDALGVGGTVGKRAAILSVTGTGGTGAEGPGTLISGKSVLKLKLT